jgi:hypothetical protein
VLQPGEQGVFDDDVGADRPGWGESRGDGTNSLAGSVTINAAGVARFGAPLQAAFALTTVPVA